MQKITTVTVFCLLALVANAAEVRTWTSTSGTHKTEAELVKVSDDGKSVTLRKTDGKEIEVPLDKLSKADSEYTAKQQKPRATITAPNARPSTGSSASGITEENFISYGDDGFVTLRTRNGTEQRNHVSVLSQDEMRDIIELEIRRLAVSDKLFSPEQIREQIDAYFAANPIPPEEKMDFDSRGTGVVKRTIDRSLTPYEKSSLLLALLKFQEVLDKKYTESTFDDVMQEVRRRKNPYGEIIDVYVIAKDFDRFYRSSTLGRSATNLMLMQAGGDAREILRDAGQLNSEAEIRMMARDLSAVQSRDTEEKNEDERAKKKIAEVLPYCNKFSAFKYTKEETERLKKQEEENRKKQFDEKSKDLFK